jgi:hypothetical protein
MYNVPFSRCDSRNRCRRLPDRPEPAATPACSNHEFSVRHRYPVSATVSSAEFRNAYSIRSALRKRFLRNTSPCPRAGFWRKFGGGHQNGMARLDD